MNPTALIISVIGLILIVLNVYFMTTLRVPDPYGALEYKDLVSILLTAVTVVLAVLGIAIAILAIWGYKEFMAKAESKATESAGAVAKTLVDTYLTSEEFSIRFAQAAERLNKEKGASRVALGDKPDGKGVDDASPQEHFPPYPDGEQ
jgi:heme/copper-type cytochrome/quinol oxidase subunit 2